MQQLNVLLHRESFIYEISYDTVTWGRIYEFHRVTQLTVMNTLGE